MPQQLSQAKTQFLISKALWPSCCFEKGFELWMLACIHWKPSVVTGGRCLFSLWRPLHNETAWYLLYWVIDVMPNIGFCCKTAKITTTLNEQSGCFIVATATFLLFSCLGQCCDVFVISYFLLNFLDWKAS